MGSALVCQACNGSGTREVITRGRDGATNEVHVKTREVECTACDASPVDHEEECWEHA